MRTPFVTLLVAFGAMASASAAFAQTDLHLNPGAPEACVFEVGQDGIIPYLYGSTGALQAHGVFGAGCTVGEPAQPPSATPPVIRLWAPETYTIGSGPLTLRWRASADAKCTFVSPAGWTGPTTACDGRDQCLGDLDDAKTATFSPPSNLDAGNHDFGVMCEGSSQAKTSSVTVVAGSEGGSEPSYCAGTPPPGITRMITGTVFYYGPIGGSEQNNPLTEFRHVFGRDRQMTPSEARPWPRFHGAGRGINQPRNRYIALQFTVPIDAPTMYGTFGFSSSDMVPIPQYGMASVSVCPGDFGQYAQYPIEDVCKKTGSFGNGGVGWEVGHDLSHMCSLERGKTYYLNLRSDCESSNCRYTMSNSAPGVTGDMNILLDMGILTELGLGGK